jgi:hypothetical protein
MTKDRRPTTPEEEGVEELPDAWERFEKAFDKVMKAKPMPHKDTKVDAPAEGKPRRGRPKKRDG